MDHQDHVNLLRPGIPTPGGTWADFGSGRGAFTAALAQLIGPAGQIVSVDKSPATLEQGRRAVTDRFPGSQVRTQAADFTQSIDSPQLDGLVVANALHFYKEKDKTVRILCDYLKPSGRFIVVEYNTDRGNRWVPFPFSFPSLMAIAQRCGLQKPILLATVPSSFLGQFYSALSFKSYAAQSRP